MATWLGVVRYRPAVVLALLLDRPLDARYFGLSFPRAAGGQVGAVCVSGNKPGDLVPAGQGLLLAFARPESAPDLLGKEAKGVLAAMLPDIQQVFPEIRASIVRARVYRWEHGQPTFYPGYAAHLENFRAGGPEGNGPVALAGDYLHFPSVEGAVTSGEDAAARLLQRL
jgi:oxygen-dependent protoporphyrinogen oxidase